MSQPGPLMVVLSGGSGFSPASITGLAGWWDASDKSTLFTDSGLTTPVVNDADPIGGWLDKSGGGNHMTQATAGSRPLYKAAIVNGLSVARFDNTDDFVSRSTFVAGAVAQPSTMFYVTKPSTTAIFQEPMDGVTARQSIINGDGTKWGMFAGGVVTGTTAVSTAAATILVGIFNGAASKLYPGGGAGQTLSPGANAINGVRIGRGTDGVNLNGDFYEGLIYSGAKTLAEINTLAAYLTRWGAAWTTAT